MRRGFVVFALMLAAVGTANAQDCIPYDTLLQSGQRPPALASASALASQRELLYTGGPEGAAVYRVAPDGDLWLAGDFAGDMAVERLLLVGDLLGALGETAAGRRLELYDVEDPVQPQLLRAAALPPDASLLDIDIQGAWLEYEREGEDEPAQHRHRWQDGELVWQATLALPPGHRFAAVRHPWAFLFWTEDDEWGYGDDQVQIWNCTDPAQPADTEQRLRSSGNVIYAVQLAGDRITVHGKYVNYHSGGPCSTYYAGYFELDAKAGAIELARSKLVTFSAEWGALIGGWVLSAGDSHADIHLLDGDGNMAIALDGALHSAAVAGGWWYLADDEGVLAVELRAPSPMPVLGAQLSGGGAPIASSSACFSLLSGSDLLLTSTLSELFVLTDDGAAGLDIVGHMHPGMLRELLAADGLLYASRQSGIINPHYKLSIVDLADPTAPALVGEREYPGPTGRMALRDETLYLTAGEEGLFALDVADPAAPLDLSQTFQGENLADACFWDDLLLLGGRNLLVCELPSPEQPVLVTQLALPGAVQRMVRYKNLLLLCLGETGLRIVDMADPRAPVIVAEQATPAEECLVDGDLAYLRGSETLAVLDMSDPAHTVELARYDHDGRWRHMALSSSGLIVGLGNQPCHAHHALQVFPRHCAGEAEFGLDGFAANASETGVELNWSTHGTGPAREYRVVANSELGASRILAPFACGFGAYGAVDRAVDLVNGGRQAYELQTRVGTSDWQPLATEAVDLPTTITVLVGTWPNPFNPRATVRLYQGQTRDARVEILDVLGRRVRILHKGTLAAGRHELSWDGHEASGAPAASGVYFVRFATGDLSETRKLVLVR